MTINGARFLGVEEQTGSLEVGKLADLAAFDLSDFAFQPLYHPVSQLIYTATGQNVSHVWINGKLLLQDKTFVHADLHAIVARTATWQERIKQTLTRKSSQHEAAST